MDHFTCSTLMVPNTFKCLPAAGNATVFAAHVGYMCIDVAGTRWTLDVALCWGPAVCLMCVRVFCLFVCFCAGGHHRCWGRASGRSWSWRMFIRLLLSIWRTTSLRDSKGMCSLRGSESDLKQPPNRTLAGRLQACGEIGAYMIRLLSFCHLTSAFIVQFIFWTSL